MSGTSVWTNRNRFAPLSWRIFNISTSSKIFLIKEQKNILWFSSFLLFLFGTLGGGLNYSVQVVAANALALEDYGRMNSWLANTLIFLSIGGLLQVSAIFFPLSKVTLARASMLLLILSILTGLFLISSVTNERLTPWGWTFASLPLALGSGWIAGQLQLRLGFIGIGLSGLTGAATKFGIASLPMVSESGLIRFYLAFTLSQAFAAMVLSFFGIWAQDLGEYDTSASDQARPKMICAVILTLAGSLLPQIDLISLRNTQSAAILGVYARATLFAKATWFGASTVLQITLPLRVLAHNSGRRSSIYIKVIEGLVFGFGFAIAFLSFWLGPIVAHRFLGFELVDYRLWILLSCLNSIALFTILRNIQAHCSRLDWVRGGIVAIMVMAPMGCASLVDVIDVSSYLWISLFYYCSILVVHNSVAKRSL